MNVCAIVAAGGRSRRFGDGDKLQQDLGGRPVLVRTVEAFTREPRVGAIVVAGPGDPDDYADFAARFGPTLGFHGATLVPGGREHRWQSVRAALAAVPGDATHVAIHDAARPALSKDLLGRVLDAALSLDAVVPALPIAETLKRAAPAGVVVGDGEEDGIADLILGDVGRVRIDARPVAGTVDRRDLHAAQTPQVFAVDLIRRAYAGDVPADATDDAALVEAIGAVVHLVPGDPRNVKITSREDLELVRAILRLA